MRNNYYVYAYLRDNMSPYYVGKGTGNRAYQKNKKTHKFVNIPKDKTKIVYLVENLTEEDALIKEKEIIKKYGRKIDGGILVNISEGGEKGYAAMKGKNHTEESKNKMSNSHKGRNAWNKGKTGVQIHSDETKQKISTISKGNKSRTGQKQSEEERNKKSESLKKYYAERRKQGHKR
jgi:hypothetical protein